MIVPIAVLIVGTNMTTMVGVAAFSALWPMLLNSAAAMRAVPVVRLDGAQSLGLSMTQRWFKIVLPSLTPGIALGLKVATPIALIVTLVVELLTASGGVGLLLLTSQRTFDSASVFALLALAGIIGFLVNTLVTSLESRILRHWTGGE